MFKDGLFLASDLMCFLDMASSIIDKYGEQRLLNIVFNEATKDY